MAKSREINTLFTQEVGNNIRQLRLKNNLSLEKLGLEIGLSRMSVHRIEKGYNITLTTILKISIALSVTPDALLKTDLKFKPEDLERLVNNNKSNRK